MEENGSPPDIGITAERWVGAGEAARAASVDPSTMRRWAHAGKVRSRTTPGGTTQIALDSLITAFERETTARATGRRRHASATVEQANPEAVIAHLAVSATSWTHWHPQRLPTARLLGLRDQLTDLADGLAGLADTINDELSARDDL